MGYYGEFDYALWATVANLVMRYRPLRKILLCALGHCSQNGYALWAIAGNEAVQQKSVTISALWGIRQDLILCNRPYRRIWLSALGHSTQVGYALCAKLITTAQNYVPPGPSFLQMTSVLLLIKE
jgi:hypothetical protein